MPGLRSSLAFHALIFELAGHAVFRILMRLLLLGLVTELAGPELELGNDMRILTGHDYHTLWVEHVRD
jgi:hypothetical protein